MMETIGRFTVYNAVYIVSFLLARVLYEDVFELEYSSNAYLFGLLMGVMFAPLWKWVTK